METYNVLPLLLPKWEGLGIPLALGPLVVEKRRSLEGDVMASIVFAVVVVCDHLSIAVSANGWRI